MVLTSPFHVIPANRSLDTITIDSHYTAYKTGLGIFDTTQIHGRVKKRVVKWLKTIGYGAECCGLAKQPSREWIYFSNRGTMRQRKKRVAINFHILCP